MIGRTGFDRGVRHGEGLEQAAHLSVIVKFADVVVVRRDGPPPFVSFRDAVKGANWRLDGDTAIDWSDAFCLALKILVQAELCDVLLGFTEPQANACSQPDLGGSGPSLHFIANGAHHLSVSMSTEDRVAVMRC